MDHVIQKINNFNVNGMCLENNEFVYKERI